VVGTLQIRWEFFIQMHRQRRAIFCQGGFACLFVVTGARRHLIIAKEAAHLCDAVRIGLRGRVRPPCFGHQLSP
jgi:hypothetical protein